MPMLSHSWPPAALIVALALSVWPVSAALGFLASACGPSVLVGEAEESWQADGNTDERLIGRLFDGGHETLVGPGVRFDMVNAKATQVLATFGPTRRISMGSPARDMYCYVSARPADATGVLFLETRRTKAADQYFWDPEYVQEIQVHAVRRRIIQLALCAPSPWVSAALASEGGLRLGLSREEVHALLGPPHAVTNGKYLYAGRRTLSVSPIERLHEWHWSGERTMRKTIEVWFNKAGKVSGFTLYREVF